MTDPNKIIRPAQDIETIIHSFEQFGLGDIKHNESKPIAAFILSICFIDQLSSFRYYYREPYSLRADKLVKRYLPVYKDLNFYKHHRNKLIHNYSSVGKFDIDNVGYDNEPYFNDGKIIHINTIVFATFIEIAFNNICEEFRKVNSEAYKNARETSKEYPVLVNTR